MSSFNIQINGRIFLLWETALLQRSIDANCGIFRFTNSSTIPGQSYPVKEGDYVNILINGITKLSGFVDEISVVSDATQHTITVSGRDTVSDLIDSSVPDSAKVTEGPVTLLKLCEKVISGLNASIYVNENIKVKEFTTDDLQVAGSGDNAMEFLMSFARKRQVFLVSDGLGDLVIYRPGNVLSNTPLLRQINGTKNNVISSSGKVSSQNRYHYIKCKSADNFGSDDNADYVGEGTFRVGQGVDSAIRKSRYLEIQAEESMTDEECKQRAKEEINVRRARGNEYTATIVGFDHSDGKIWDFGQLVQVNDEFSNMLGQFIIKSVELAIDLSSGSRTKIVCASPDAYQVLDEIPVSYSRKSKFGPDL